MIFLAHQTEIATLFAWVIKLHLTQVFSPRLSAPKITQNLEITRFWGLLCKKKNSQLIGFAGVCSRVAGFGARGGCLTAGLLQQGCRCRGLRETFSRFYRRHYGLVSKYNVGLRALLGEGLSGPGFCGDLVCRLRGLGGVGDFSLRFGGVVSRCGRVGCSLSVVRQSACLVFGPVVVGGCAAFFGCTPVGRASDSMMAPT